LAVPDIPEAEDQEEDLGCMEVVKSNVISLVSIDGDAR
jgi:hypothetical protein